MVGPRLTAYGPFGPLRTVIRVAPLFRDPDLCRGSHGGIMLGFIDKTSYEPRPSQYCRLSGRADACRADLRGGLTRWNHHNLRSRRNASAGKRPGEA